MNTLRSFLNENTLNEAAITVYHGDNFNTTKLEPKLMNNGNNQEGVGIYFSTNLESAQDYGKNVISVSIDTKKFIPARDLVQKHLPQNKIAKLFEGLHKFDEEAFYYYMTDYIEISDIPDIEPRHFTEMASHVKTEQVRNFQVQMADTFNSEIFVELWNKIFPGIHGTFNSNSSDEDWYCIINDKLKVQKVENN